MGTALNIRLAGLETDAGNELADGDGGQPPMGEAREPGGEKSPPEPFERTLARWLVLSEASNNIDRCMGLPDLYPFVISPAAAGKLAFMHCWPPASRQIGRTLETVCNKTSWPGVV